MGRNPQDGEAGKLYEGDLYLGQHPREDKGNKI